MTNKILAGYKQTKVGIIPEDWNYSIIGNVVKIKTGKKNTQDKVNNGKYPFFVRSQTVERINTYSYDEEAILTAGDGVGTGKVFHYIKGKFECHQRVYILNPFYNSLHGYYFFLFFSYNFYNQFIQMTAKTSVDSVRKDMIYNMPILLPTSKEQKHISKAIHDINNLITSLEELISKKELIKKGAMQVLLTGKKRLSGFGDGKGYKQTELEFIPEDWGIASLKNLFSISAGGDINRKIFKKDKDNNYKFPIFSNSVSNKGLYGFSNNYKSESNSITISARGTIGKAFYRNQAYTAIGRLLILYPKIKINCFYVSEYINERISFDVEVTGVPQLTAPKAGEYRIALPKIKEQQAIAKILTDMDLEIEALENKLKKYKLVKQGMMQNLLTGKIRLV